MDNILDKFMITQTKTLSASKVKNSFGAIVRQVANGKYNEVIVENHGEPLVAIVPVRELETIKQFKDQERRNEALRRLRALRNKIQSRMNDKLTDEEAMAIVAS